MYRKPAHLKRALWRCSLALLLCATAVSLVACGASSDGTTFTVDEVVPAFERAGGEYPFKRIVEIEPIPGAVAYGPQGNSGPAAEKRLYAGLGQHSLFWQVVIFRGPEPPTGAEAARRAAGASKTWRKVGDGIFLGDRDIAYVARGNVVVLGEVADGNVHDERLKRWTAVLDGL
jgi:hypothetical protein